jgi:hypothetical protein
MKARVCVRTWSLVDALVAPQSTCHSRNHCRQPGGLSASTASSGLRRRAKRRESFWWVVAFHSAILLPAGSSFGAEFNIADGDVAGLIAAIDTANANGEADVINLAVDGTYSLLVSLPSLTSEITINGNGSTVQRDTLAPNFGILATLASGDVKLNDMTIRNGFPRGVANFGRLEANNVTIRDNTAFLDAGGGLVNWSGATLILRHCRIVDNQGSVEDAPFGGGMANLGRAMIEDSVISGNSAPNGGGIFVFDGSELEVLRSTISGNTATDGYGAAIGSIGPAVVTLVNSTISENIGAGNAIGISYSEGSLTLTNCTVTGNQGVGVYSESNTSSINLTNTIIANNGASDCISNSPITDLGYNIDSDGSCISHATSFAADPMLGPLSDNGGPTMTHALLAGSPAINAGDCAGGTITEDQRGVARPQGPACDIGAYEGCTIPNPIPDGDVDSLIQAILCANESVQPSVIHLAEGGTYTLTKPFAANDPFGLPMVIGDLTIQGNGATIERSDASGTPQFSILRIAAHARLVMNALTIRNGISYLPQVVGGIWNQGTLEATEVTVSDNYSSYNTGGITNHPNATLKLSRCVISGNTSGGEDGGGPGGILNYGNAIIEDSSILDNHNLFGTTCGAISNVGTLSLIRSVVAGNSNFFGGGICAHAGSLSAENSTISSNISLEGGAVLLGGNVTVNMSHCTIAGNDVSGIFAEVGLSGDVTLSNTVVADNGSGDCVGLGTDIDNGHNIDSDGSCISHATSFTADPMLGPLADNGGPTMTHALLAGSPAINAGDCAGETITEDQRGVARPHGPACDIGAFEWEGEIPPGDFNLDGVADLEDLAILQECMNGPAVTPSSDCLVADLSGDGFVDMRDLAEFQTVFGAGQ